MVISGVMTLIIGLALKATMGWRIPEEDEIEGIDVVVHGEQAYELDAGGGSGHGVLTKSLSTSVKSEV